MSLALSLNPVEFNNSPDMLVIIFNDLHCTDK
jgi:hypothetical protein